MASMRAFLRDFHGRNTFLEVPADHSTCLRSVKSSSTIVCVRRVRDEFFSVPAMLQTRSIPSQRGVQELLSILRCSVASCIHSQCANGRAVSLCLCIVVAAAFALWLCILSGLQNQTKASRVLVPGIAGVIHIRCRCGGTRSNTEMICGDLNGQLSLFVQLVRWHGLPKSLLMNETQQALWWDYDCKAEAYS